MGFRLKLLYATWSFDLNNTTYYPTDDFIPPAMVETLAMAKGDGNSPAGGTITSRYTADREWQFSLIVTGASVNACRSNLRRLQDFLERADDYENERMWLEHDLSGALSYTPVFGQGPFRYWVKAGRIEHTDLYTRGGLNGGWMKVTLVLTIAPCAYGLSQVLGKAAGGVYDERSGASDDAILGTVVPTAGTNLLNNPSFETDMIGWTAEAGCSIDRTTAYAKSGYVSLKVTPGGGNKGGYHDQLGLINGHTYTFSCFMSGGIGETLQIRVYNGSEYASAGATGLGWGQWVRLSVTAVMAIGTTMTVYVESAGGVSIAYADCCQLEDSPYVTPYIDGDQLGCAWSGSAHGSSSSRTAGNLIYSGSLVNSLHGTIVMAVKHGWSSTGRGTTATFFHMGVMTGYFYPNDDRIYIYDGSAHYGTGVVHAFSAGDIDILHFVWSTTGINVYINGVAGASAAYTPAAITNLWIGTSNVAGYELDSIILLCNTYGETFSQADVTAQYNEMAWIRTATNPRRLGGLPWLWTKDGDAVLDNHDDSGHDNYAVIGGIQGDLEAETVWNLAPSVLTHDSYWLMRAISDNFVNPSGQWYGEQSGTADAGNASGDAYLQSATTGSSQVILAGYYALTHPEFAEGPVHYFCRLGHSTAVGVFSLQPWYTYQGQVIAGAVKPITILAGYTWYYAGDLFISHHPNVIKSSWKLSAGIQLVFTGASGNAKMDFIMAVTGPLVRIRSTTDASWTKILLNGRRGVLLDSGGAEFHTVDVDGEAVHLVPNKLNYIFGASAEDGAAHTLTDTLTLDPVTILPRWRL